MPDHYEDYERLYPGHGHFFDDDIFRGEHRLLNNRQVAQVAQRHTPWTKLIEKDPFRVKIIRRMNNDGECQLISSRKIKAIVGKASVKGC